MKWLVRERAAHWLTFTHMIEADSYDDAMDKWAEGQSVEFGAPEIGEYIDTPIIADHEVFRLIDEDEDETAGTPTP